jgi:hypothetical protein
MGRGFNQGYATIRGVLQGHIKFNSLAGYGCRFGVIELSFVRVDGDVNVDGDAEAVKVRMEIGAQGVVFGPTKSRIQGIFILRTGDKLATGCTYQTQDPSAEECQCRGFGCLSGYDGGFQSQRTCLKEVLRAVGEDNSASNKDVT